MEAYDPVKSIDEGGARIIERQNLAIDRSIDLADETVRSDRRNRTIQSNRAMKLHDAIGSDG
jgi:hypothetical protein